jgi:hypothetical protein
MTQPAGRESGHSERRVSPTISGHLVSLAILKENWNQGQTYLDNFVPFVAECLRGAEGQVTSGDVQKPCGPSSASACRKRWSKRSYLRL